MPSFARVFASNGIAFALACSTFMSVGCSADDDVDGVAPKPPTTATGCRPGTWQADDGSCVPSGIPPDGCGDGFVHDGDRACEAILPPDPCPRGMMAVPGDSECHEVAPCGTGTWGSIPVEPDTHYVDQSYAGADSDGSAQKPWTTIGEGVAAAAPDAIVAIAAGTYIENVLVEGKPVRLWGRCPAMVAVVGTASAPAAVLVRQGAAGAAVRDLAVRGQTVGLLLSGAENVIVERVWIDSPASAGLAVEDEFGATAMVVRGTLIDSARDIGVFVYGSDVTIEASVVRDTQPAPDQAFGQGLSIEDDPDSGRRASVAVKTSVVERNRDTGVFVGGSDVTLEASVVRDTAPQASDQRFGRGIDIRDDPASSQRSSVAVTTSVVARNREIGVMVAGSDLTIEASVVRDTEAQASDQLWGQGIAIQIAPEGGERSSVAVKASVVERNREAGVVVVDSDAAIERSVVRDTMETATGGAFGDGIIAWSLDGPTSVTVTATRVEQSARAAVATLGADLGLGGSELVCQAFDIFGADYVAIPFTLDDLGGNLCGCPEATGVCAAKGGGLEPPPPVGGLE